MPEPCRPGGKRRRGDPKGWLLGERELNGEQFGEDWGHATTERQFFGLLIKVVIQLLVFNCGPERRTGLID